MNLRSLPSLAIVFVVAYSVIYLLAVWNNYALFTYHPALNEIGMAGFVAMMVFLGILVVGFIYEWKKGALEWD